MLRATFRSLLARKLRLLLSATAVVLGVAFVAGSLTLTDTLGRVFDDLFTSVNAKTDVEVRGAPVFAEQDDGPRAPVPAALLTTVTDVPGVVRAVGNVQGYAQLLEKDGSAYSTGGAPAFGINYDPDPRSSTIELAAGAAPSGPSQVAVDAGTARKTGYRPGDAVTVQLVSGPARFTVSGTFAFGSSGSVGGASIVAFDDATAQRLLGRPGEYASLSLTGDDGLSQTALRARVAAVLPAGYQAITGEQNAKDSADDIKGALGFFTTFLLVFAAVALFVGAFLIFNTFSILVAQRQRELALLRALGASRRQVTTSVLAESVVVGLVASGLGLGAGVLVALGLRAPGEQRRRHAPERPARRLAAHRPGEPRGRARRHLPGRAAARAQGQRGAAGRRHARRRRAGELAAPDHGNRVRAPGPRRRRGRGRARRQAGGAGRRCAAVLPGRRRPVPPAQPACRPRARRAAVTGPGRAARPAQRDAQPPPYGVDRCRADDRPGPGQRRQRARRVRQGLRHRDRAGRGRCRPRRATPEQRRGPATGRRRRAGRSPAGRPGRPAALRHRTGARPRRPGDLGPGSRARPQRPRPRASPAT